MLVEAWEKNQTQLYRQLLFSYKSFFYKGQGFLPLPHYHAALLLVKPRFNKY